MAKSEERYIILALTPEEAQAIKAAAKYLYYHAGRLMDFSEKSVLEDQKEKLAYIIECIESSERKKQ